MTPSELTPDDIIEGLLVAATVEEAVAVLSAGRAVAMDLPAGDCRTWIERLWLGTPGGVAEQRQLLWTRTSPAVSQLGDIERDRIFVAEVEFLDQLLESMEQGGGSAGLTADAMEWVLREVVEGGASVRPPRRGFVEMYIRWLHDGYDPGIFWLHREVLRLATPADHIRIGLQMPVSSTELFDDDILHLLDRAIQSAKHLDPGAVPALTKQLAALVERQRTNLEQLKTAREFMRAVRGQSDPETLLRDQEVSAKLACAEAVLELTNAWLAGAYKALPPMEQAILSALTVTGPVDVARVTIEAAFKSLGPEDAWVRIDSASLKEALARKRDALSPRWLSDFQRGLLSPLTRAYLHAYHRHVMGGEENVVVLSSAITAAIEDHARCTLGSGLPESLRDEVWAAGLGALTGWMLGGQPDWGQLPGVGSFRVDMSQLGRDASRLRRTLQRAARLRNDVHHCPDRIAPGSHDDLFAEVRHHHSRPSVLVLMRRLRVVPGR